MDASLVKVAVTGRISVGTATAAAPTDAKTALGTGWTDLGYASDDGVTQTIDRSTEKIKAWQNADTVREVVTDASASFKFTLLETSKAAVSLYYGTAVATDGSLVVIPSQAGPAAPFILDIIDGADLIRVYAPSAQVSEVGDIVYKNGEAIGYEITITVYPSTTLGGGAFKKWISKLAG